MSSWVAPCGDAGFPGASPVAAGGDIAPGLPPAPRPLVGLFVPRLVRLRSCHYVGHGKQRGGCRSKEYKAFPALPGEGNAFCLVTWQTHPRDLKGWCQHPFPIGVFDALFMLEHSLRSGGTPRVRWCLDPGECKMPGLPNKTSSGPNTSAPYTG